MLMLQVSIFSHSIQVSSLEDNVAGLHQRVSDLEAGGGGSANVTSKNPQLFYTSL